MEQLRGRKMPGRGISETKERCQGTVNISDDEAIAIKIKD